MTIFKADFRKPCSWVRDAHIFQPNLTQEVLTWLEDFRINYDFRVDYEQIPKDIFDDSNNYWSADTRYLCCYIYIEDPRHAALFKLTWM